MFTLPFSLAAIILYLFSGYYLGRQLWQKQQARLRWPVIITATAGICHAAGLLPDLFSAQGLHLGFFNVASLIALFVVLLVLICTRLMSINILLIPIQAIAALSVLCATLFPAGNLAAINEAPGILAHILFSILAYGVITIAVVQSLFLLAQESQLRRRPVSTWLHNLPPLQTMESLLFTYLCAGWVLLSLSLLSGWIFLDNLFAQHLAHKTLLSTLAWLIFAVLLWGRYQLGWRGHKAIRLTLAGFSLLMLAYFGSKLVREFILNT